MPDFCGVHLTTRVHGVCPWCPPECDGFMDLDGRDDRLRATYNKKTGLVAKPTRQDEQIADYEDPWARAFFQPYMDFQPAPGWSDLAAFNAGEYGSMEVRGDRADALTLDVIGGIVLRFNADGEQTVAIRSRVYDVKGKNE